MQNIVRWRYSKIGYVLSAAGTVVQCWHFAKNYVAQLQTATVILICSKSVFFRKESIIKFWVLCMMKMSTSIRDNSRMMEFWTLTAESIRRIITDTSSVNPSKTLSTPRFKDSEFPQTSPRKLKCVQVSWFFYGASTLDFVCKIDWGEFNFHAKLQFKEKP